MPTQASATSLETPLASPAPGGTSSAIFTEGPSLPPDEPLTLAIDPSLEASLPQHIGSIRFVGHTLRTGDRPPSGLSNSLARALLAAATAPDDEISVAWIDPVPEDTTSVGGMTVVAIRIPSAEARRLRSLVVVDRMLVTGGTGTFGRTEDDGPTVVFGGDALVMSAADTLYVVTWPGADPSATPPPNDVQPPVSLDALLAVLPPVDPAGRSATPPPWPTDAPRGGPVEAVPAVEALLPDEIDGSVLRKVSARGASLLTSDYIYLTLPLYVLHLGGLDFDRTAMAAAAGASDNLAPYWLVASPVGAHDAREILAAWFGSLLDGPAGIQRATEYEIVEVDGLEAVVHGDQAVYAADGVFYWMTYLELGEFGPTPAPRPPLRDRVVATLHALSNEPS